MLRPVQLPLSIAPDWWLPIVRNERCFVPGFKPVPNTFPRKYHGVRAHDHNCASVGYSNRRRTNRIGNHKLYRLPNIDILLYEMLLYKQQNQIHRGLNKRFLNEKHRRLQGLLG